MLVAGADVPDASRKIGASRRGAIGSSATADGKAVADRSRGWPIGAATAEVVEAGARATGAMAAVGAPRAGAGGGGGAAASSVVAYDRGSGTPGAKAGATRGPIQALAGVRPLSETGMGGLKGCIGGRARPCEGATRRGMTPVRARRAAVSAGVVEVVRLAHDR
jgi:hypothetical protein